MFSIKYLFLFRSRIYPIDLICRILVVLVRRSKYLPTISPTFLFNNQLGEKLKKVLSKTISLNPLLVSFKTSDTDLYGIDVQFTIYPDKLDSVLPCSTIHRYSNTSLFSFPNSKTHRIVPNHHQLYRTFPKTVIKFSKEISFAWSNLPLAFIPKNLTRTGFLDLLTS